MARKTKSPKSKPEILWSKEEMQVREDMSFWLRGQDCKYYPFLNKGANIRLSFEQQDVFRRTVGFPFSLAALKVYLAQKCNIQSPLNYSIFDIIVALESSLQRKKEDEQSGSGGKADLPNEKSAGKKQDAKRTIAAILISLIMILLFELFVYFGPVTWFRNHPHSPGIQGSIDCLFFCMTVGLFKPRWRKWYWGAAIAFLVGLVSLL